MLVRILWINNIVKSSGYHSAIKRCLCTVNLNGIFPPILTPFSFDESISYEKLQRNVEKWSKISFAGYVVQGSNGEYPFLTPAERVEVVKKVKSLIPSNKLLIAGSATSATVQMSSDMAKNGADAVLVVTPSFYKNQTTPKALFEHYTEVANQSKVPVILYNVPSNTGINIPVDVVSRLARHPNIIGIKDSGGDITRIGLLVHLTKSYDFQVLAGSAGFLLASYCVGAVGGVCALANVLGEEVCELHNLFKENRWEEAKNLQHRLIAPNSVVTAVHGVPGLVVAMKLFGYNSGRPRSPLQSLNDEDARNVRQAFEENGFL